MIRFKHVGSPFVSSSRSPLPIPGFIHDSLPDGWGLLLMMAGNAAMIYVPGLPIWVGLLVAFAVRNIAVYFTRWYPRYRRAKYGTPPANALPGTH